MLDAVANRLGMLKCYARNDAIDEALVVDAIVANKDLAGCSLILERLSIDLALRAAVAAVCDAAGGARCFTVAKCCKSLVAILAWVCGVATAICNTASNGSSIEVGRVGSHHARMAKGAVKAGKRIGETSAEPRIPINCVHLFVFRIFLE